MRPREALLSIAALVAGVGAARLALRRDFEPYQTAAAPVALLVGWSFIGSGLIAWRQRPDNRLGPAMVLTGFGWFASFLTDAHDPWLFTAGTALESVYLVGFAFVLLSFPTGRLEGRPERVVIGSTIALTCVLGPVALLFAESGPVLCSGCPGNVVELDRIDGLARGILELQRFAAVAVILVTLGLLARRWHGASAPLRRGLAPVLAAGSAILIALAASVANDAVGGPLGQAAKVVLFVALATLPVAVLAVLLQRRLARAAVAGLVVELGGRGAAIDLREALARALGDSSLQLAYWYPAGSRYVDGDGSPVELPQSDPLRASTILERAGEPVAAIVHDPALLENVELVDSVCAAASLTLENERLQAELRARLVELQASRARLVDATEAERRRIERDLHDGTQQRLVSIAMSLGLLESKLPSDPRAAGSLAREARQALGAALEELRELSQGIYPSVLTERGLDVALDDLGRRAALPVRLELSLDRRLPPEVEAAAYFLASEALTNAAKHSRASGIRISASTAEGVFVLEVADDGIGGADPGTGSGLPGLADRIEAVGGRLMLSSPPGRGTILRAELPCG